MRPLPQSRLCQPLTQQQFAYHPFKAVTININSSAPVDSPDLSQGTISIHACESSLGSASADMMADEACSNESRTPSSPPAEMRVDPRES